MDLRYYQSDAIRETYRLMRGAPDSAPCIVLPTGAGKTPVLSSICTDAAKAGKRVLILAHVKELLQQAHATLSAFMSEGEVGLYSAGLKSRDTDHPVLICGIQSVAKRANEIGHVDLVIVDEAHLIPLSGEGQYRTFLADLREINPNVKLIGLTATPYRLHGGSICGDDHLLNYISYEIGVKELIDGGYLCPLRSKTGVETAKPDTSSVHTRAGEFVASELNDAVDGLVVAAVRDFTKLSEGRRKVLVFSCGVEHGEAVTAELKRMGHDAVEVYGDTLFRDEAIGRFKNEDSCRFLVNCAVLTTGFDFTEIDCVVLLRPTQSAGLYYQMVGRGLRLNDNKQDCLVLDYGDNILRHGPINEIEVSSRDIGEGASPMRTCHQCQAIVAASYTECPECGYVFPVEQRAVTHDTSASTADILGTEKWHPVHSVGFYKHESRNNPDSVTMRVDYNLSLTEKVSEYICIEHYGYARTKAEKWWRDNVRAECPDSVELAIVRAENYARNVSEVKLKRDGKYTKVSGVRYAE